MDDKAMCVVLQFMLAEWLLAAYTSHQQSEIHVPSYYYNTLSQCLHAIPCPVCRVRMLLVI